MVLTFTMWHLEDMAMAALNQLEWGADKLWFLTPTVAAGEKLRALLSQGAPKGKGAKNDRLHQLYRKVGRIT